MPYVETVMLTVQFAQDEIIWNLVLIVSLKTIFSSSWLSRTDIIDQDDPSWMSLEFDFF